MKNPYLAEIEVGLPRLLSLYDTDPYRATLGVGDRLRWSWKTVDFFNATYQTPVGGVARLIAKNSVPEGIGQRSLLTRVEQIISAIPLMVSRNGSLQEVNVALNTQLSAYASGVYFLVIKDGGQQYTQRLILDK